MKYFAIFCLAAFAVSCGAEPFGECPPEDGELPTYLPDLIQPNVFWECNSGIPRMLTCPGQLIHDPNMNVCDFPSTESKPFGPIGNCGKEDVSLLRDGLNIAVYYDCKEGNLEMQKCPDGKWFSADYGGFCYVKFNFIS